MAQLRRTLGLGALIFYGVGDILGAGIYALVGAVAGLAGTRTWQSFGVAMFVASFTALSYAELAGRFPRSSGEAYYSERAFRWPGLALLIGWLSFASGIVSMATASRAFAGYLLPPISAAWSLDERWTQPSAMLFFLLIVASITFWGIRQSSLANIVCTVVEASGLLIVIVVGVSFLVKSPPEAAGELAAQRETWQQVARGGALAFFAFIGFEDIVKVAEEAKRPQRDLPIAILVALLAAGCMYILIGWIATAVVPPAQLHQSEGPLLAVVNRAAPGFPMWLFGLIALMAIANTALLNYVMASRLLYGMARQRLVPAWLGAVSPATQTPHWAILLILATVLLLALSGSLAYLAGTTSVLLLAVFASVNLSLVAIKLREPPCPQGFRVPLGLPLVGAVTSIGLLFFVPRQSLFTATVFLVLGLIMVVVHWWNRDGTASAS